MQLMIILHVASVYLSTTAVDANHVHAPMMIDTYTLACLLQVWPNKGLHFAMLAKVSALLERNQEAIEYANKALQQLQYTHADSPVVEEVRQIMFEAGRSHQDMF